MIRNITRQTRRKFNAEEQIRIVLAGLRGEDSIAELCRREGIHQNLDRRTREDVWLRGDNAILEQRRKIKAKTLRLRKTVASTETGDVRSHSVSPRRRRLKPGLVSEVDRRLAAIRVESVLSI